MRRTPLYARFHCRNGEFALPRWISQLNLKYSAAEVRLFLRRLSNSDWPLACFSKSEQSRTQPCSNAF